MDDGIIYVTRECHEKMIRQLNDLVSVKRKDIARQIAEARAHGDLGENAEYDAAKETQVLMK